MLSNTLTVQQESPQWKATMDSQRINPFHSLLEINLTDSAGCNGLKSIRFSLPLDDIIPSGFTVHTYTKQSTVMCPCVSWTIWASTLGPKSCNSTRITFTSQCKQSYFRHCTVKTLTCTTPQQWCHLCTKVWTLWLSELCDLHSIEWKSFNMIQFWELKGSGTSDLISAVNTLINQYEGRKQKVAG